MNRRFLAAAFALLTVVACTQSDVTSPGNVDGTGGPSLAIVDADNGTDGVDGFWFLPPLAKQATTEGTFDAEQSPTMSVCEIDLDYSVPAADLPIDQLESYGCRDSGPYSDPALSFSVGAGNYQFSWDTSPDQADNTTFFPMDDDRLYRIQIFVDGTRLGYYDVNPQNPSGQTPGEDYDGLYAFRLGETIPVKFYLSPQVRCATTEFVDYLPGGVPLGYVKQCAAEGVIDTNGGAVVLSPILYNGEVWPTIVIDVPAGALPAGVGSAILRMERIDPGAYFLAFQEECIPGFDFGGGVVPFDAPQFGDCLRVTTEPALPQLEAGYLAEVAICIDMDTYLLLESQHVRPQIIRYSESGIFEGLAMNEPSTDISDPNLCDVYNDPQPLPGSTGGSVADATGFFPVPQDEGLMRTAALAANTFAGWFGPTPLGAHERDIRLSGSTSGFSNFRWALLGEMEFGDLTGSDFVEADSRVIQIPEGSTADIPLDLAVRVLDSGGDDDDGDGVYEPADPVEGATVHFWEGGSEVASATTAAEGLAPYTWTLAATEGVYTIEARALGLFAEAVPDHDFVVPFDGVESIQYTATLVGGPNGGGSVPDDGTTFEGPPGSQYTITLSVTWSADPDDPNAPSYPVDGYVVDPDILCDLVNVDDCGSAIVNDGAPGNNTTGPDGTATVTWTVSSVPATTTLVISIGDYTYTFYSIAGCQVDVNGVVGEGEWDCAADNTVTFPANISGGTVMAEFTWQTDGSEIFFLVRVPQTSLDKVNSLRIDFDNGGNGASGDDDIIGFLYDGVGTGPDADDAYDWYLTDRCVNRSQSSCGAADTSAGGTKNVVGALDNDGQWTVYELSHPLSGGARDFSKASGDQLGLFLTLSIGKGAQGNTQWPGFRDYLTITIR